MYRIQIIAEIQKLVGTVDHESYDYGAEFRQQY